MISVDVARLRRVVGLFGVVIALWGAGWDLRGAAPAGALGLPTVLAQDMGSARGLHQRQLAFLQRLRHADPHYQTIEKAVFNAQNELGVILNREVELDTIRPLMRTILTQMAQDFPGHDLMVIAYAPSAPPREIGTARLNARTREMTYTPAVPAERGRKE